MRLVPACALCEPQCGLIGSVNSESNRSALCAVCAAQVELQHQLSSGVQPILVSHSYGATVTVTFLHWVEQQEPGWVDKYLAGYVNLAGPLLGLPKAISPMLSGGCWREKCLRVGAWV